MKQTNNYRPEKVNNIETIEPARVIRFADGTVGEVYDSSVSDEICLHDADNNRLIADISIGGDGLLVVALDNNRQLVIADGMVYDERTGEAKIAPAGFPFPDIVFGMPYEIPGVFRSEGSVKAVLSEVTRAAGADLTYISDEQSPFGVARTIITEKREKFEQQQRTEKIISGLPVGFKTEMGSQYFYTPEGHSERWKFDGTHHEPQGIAVFLPGNGEAFDIFSSLGVQQNHLPKEEQQRVYICEIQPDKGKLRKIYDIARVINPNMLVIARIDHDGKGRVMRFAPVSLYPKKDEFVFEMSKLVDGRTSRHPGHRVTEIYDN